MFDFNLEIESKPTVKSCQAKSLLLVNFFQMSSFGERLKIAFQNARNAEIARKIGVSEPAIKKYMSGSMPSLDKLILIKNLTGRSLDWLIEGKDETAGSFTLDAKLREKLTQIAREQAHEIFAGADIAGPNIDERTMQILTEYLINRAMQEYNLISDEVFLMDAKDRYRAERFTFVRAKQPDIEERFRQIILDELAKAGIGDDSVRVEPGELVPVKHGGTVDGGESEEVPLRKTG